MSPILKYPAQARYRATLTPEQRLAAQRKYHSELTPERKEEIRAQARRASSKYRDSLPPDQKTSRRKEKRKVKFANHLKRTYNLTPEEWEQIFEAQGRRCGICRADSEKWHTDHCHATKRVRGILCHGCNVGLGYFKENLEALKRAIGYLT